MKTDYYRSLLPYCHSVAKPCISWEKFNRWVKLHEREQLSCSLLTKAPVSISFVVMIKKFNSSGVRG